MEALRLEKTIVPPSGVQPAGSTAPAGSLVTLVVTPSETRTVKIWGPPDVVRSNAIIELSGDQRGPRAPPSPSVSCWAFEPSASMTNTCSFPFRSRSLYVTIEPSNVASNADALEGAVIVESSPDPTSTMDSVCSTAPRSGATDDVVEPSPPG